MRNQYGKWLLILTMCSSSALGQQSNPRVSEILRRGVQLRQQGRDEAALQEFLRASQISSEPRVIAQIGLAEQALQRWSAAERHLRAALAASQDDYIVRHRAVIQGALEEIGRHLGSVEVTGGVPGAQVWLNGERVGTLPMQEPARVLPGAVAMEVTAVGYTTTTRTLRVVAGGTVRERVVLSSNGTTLRAQASGSYDSSRVEVSDSVTTPPPGSMQRTWGWIALAGGVALLGGGVAGLVIHSGEVTDFNDRGCYVLEGSSVVMGPSASLAACTADHASIAGTLGIVGLVGGGVLTTLSVVLLATSPSRGIDTSQQGARFGCGQGPGLIGVACGGTF